MIPHVFLVDVQASFVPGDISKITPKWAEINYETGCLLDRNLPLTPESKDLERLCDNTKKIHGKIIDKLRYNLLGHLATLVRKYNLRCDKSFQPLKDIKSIHCAALQGSLPTPEYLKRVVEILVLPHKTQKKWIWDATEAIEKKYSFFIKLGSVDKKTFVEKIAAHDSKTHTS